MLREINLFPEWFVAKELGRELNFKQRQLWQQTIDTLLPPLLAQPQVYVHRDFIVRNLMLTTGRPGVLDFQDALYGPISYDLVSLLRDAFIDGKKNSSWTWSSVTGKKHALPSCLCLPSLTSSPLV